MPSHLHQSAKDLLANMLLVDPLKRITIPEIRKMEWFSKDLPVYLQKPAVQSDKQFFARPLDTIVTEISKVTAILNRK